MDANRLNIAAALREISMLLELKGDKYYQARAYRNAGQVVAELKESLTSLIEENRLTTIPGIGPGIAREVEQLYHSGSSTLLNRLREELPRGSVELAAIPGLTLKKIQQLQEAIGIESVAQLKEACEKGQVRSVKGFGPKTEQKLLEAISPTQESSREMHVHKALQVAEEIVSHMRLAESVKQVEIAGPLRRWRETTPDITVAVSATSASAALDHFTAFPMLVRVTERTEESCTGILISGVKASIIVSRPERFGATLLNATGSPDHVQHLARIAREKGLLQAARRSKAPGREAGSIAQAFQIAGETESEIYERLGMQYIPPELREDEGEIEAAIEHKLSDRLVTLGDIRGMVHCHTNYSDGTHTVEEMARGAEALGMSYLTITDHSPTAFYAGGLKVDRLKRQWEEIERVQQMVKIKLLRGTESDILADGSLDYPDTILDQFDVIVASIHSRYKMDESQMTERITRAMRQPWFKVWGHALGRLIQRRPPFNARVEEILDVIAESRAAIEINGDPYRLDMEPRWIREARKRKIRFVVSTDAHSVNAMKNVKFGVGIARRAWVRRDEVLNTLSSDRFLQAVRPKQI